jgi:hypothetical protein
VRGKRRKGDEVYRLKSRDVSLKVDNCSPDDVCRWALQGRVRGVKHGRQWRFSKGSIADVRKVVKELRG